MYTKQTYLALVITEGYETPLRVVLVPRDQVNDDWLGSLRDLAETFNQAIICLESPDVYATLEEVEARLRKMNETEEAQNG